MPGITEIADAYIEERAALDPYNATMDGIPGHDDEATDLSPRGIAERIQLDRLTLRSLNETEPANED